MATAIIQARTASTRLPGKVVLPLGGVPVIQHIVQRARKSDQVEKVVVATTFHTRDDIIEKYASDSGAHVYRGSEDDVLGRIYRSAVANRCNYIVRLTGDNPFVPVKLIDEVALRVSSGEFDYASNKETRTFPLGVDAEATSMECLERIHQEAQSQYHREHALRYVRDEGAKFRTTNIDIKELYGRDLDNQEYPRLTLDEPKDYYMFKKIFEEMEVKATTSIFEIIQNIKESKLSRINNDVEQKTL